MVIFALTFVGAISLVSGFIAFIVTSMQALLSFGALLVFAFVALAIGTHSRMAWTAMFLTVLAMVGIETLAPYSIVVSRVISVVVAAFGTYLIKSPIVRYVRHDQHRPGGPRLSAIIRTILWII